MAARLKATLRQWEVRLVWRGDDNELEGVDGEQVVERANDSRIGIEFSGGIARALENAGDAQSGNRVDYRRVEVAASKTETN